MPPIHMPAWPVSTSTMPSSGTCFVSSAHMRSGRIGTASDSSAGLYFAYHSLTIACAFSTQGLRFAAVFASACPSIFVSTTFASPSTEALRG